MGKKEFRCRGCGLIFEREGSKGEEEERCPWCGGKRSSLIACLSGKATQESVSTSASKESKSSEVRGMNGRVAKKIRKYSKRNWIEYVQALRAWPFNARLRFCWHIMFSKQTKPRGK